VHRSEGFGVNLLDTAEAYGNGHGEAVVGEALQGRRDNCLLPIGVLDIPDVIRSTRSS
jgi:aryl-alcohol dehydrogenase-like predicted oxidoreductase